ncbi:lariat debranching enzyme [Malassezia sp. CBS 17886]|nr:lariat debranching enzyme [Malassezia sp. CBS 17886]
MRIAVEGCSHGELDAIYENILAEERASGRRVDVLLLCGDLQAIRNASDLHSLAVPPKYRKLGDFYRYYAGEKTAPILTLVVGGNHEASNYMWELFYGGWIAPNIYYMGAAGCVDVAGVLVAGASGIFKQNDYLCGHHERQPFSPSDLRSVYHTRQFDISKLGLLMRPDIFLSHDWPNAVEQHGDVTRLLQRKPFFREEVQSRTLGSPPLHALLHELQPRYWFSAHLHVKFAASVPHAPVTGAAEAQPPMSTANPGAPPMGETPAAVGIGAAGNPEALDIGEESGDETSTASDDGDAVTGVRTESADTAAQLPVARPPADTAAPLPVARPALRPCTTEFLALSKCLPKHEFLHYFDISSAIDAELETVTLPERPTLPLRLPVRWLAITQVMHKYFSLRRTQPPLPHPHDAALRAAVAEAESNLLRSLAPEERDIRTTQVFVRTAPTERDGGHDPLQPARANRTPAAPEDEIAQIHAVALKRNRKRKV